MNDLMEKNYRQFRAYVTTTMFWMNEDEKQEKDKEQKEKLKQQHKERKQVLDKLEAIRVGRHLAQIGEENLEKNLYEKIWPVISERYEKTNNIDNNENEELYKTIKKLTDVYQVNKETEKEEMER